MEEGKYIKEIRFVKEEILHRTLRVLWLFMALPLIFSFWRIKALGLTFFFSFQIASFLAITLFFVFRHRIPYNYKAVGVLLISTLLSVVGIISYGIFSIGLYFLLLTMVLTAIFIHHRAGVIFLFASCVFLVLVSALYQQDIIVFKEALISSTKSPSMWLNLIISFGFISIMILNVGKSIFEKMRERIEYKEVQEVNLNKINDLLSKEIEIRKETEQLLKTKVDELTKLYHEKASVSQKYEETNLKLERTNEQLNKAKEAAQSADILKTAFLSNMSHEIRTPLNAIIGFSNLLANPNLSENERANYSEIIQTSSSHLFDIISDVVTMAKIESKQFSLFPETIELDSFIKSIEEKYYREIDINFPTGEVEFIIEKNFNPNCHIIVDQESIRQIVYKLLDNSLKFTAQGKITFRASLSDEDYLKITVADTGIGFDKIHHDEIFRNFTQLERYKTRNYGGTGLGLSIVRGLSDLLKAELKFCSNQGVGTTFVVSIPVVRKNISLKGVSDIYGKWKGRTILVVGKDVWNEGKLNKILQESGAFLVLVESGFQAIDACKFRPEISLIIMSTILPDINGREASGIIKKMYPTIPIIAYSQSNSPANELRATESSFDNMIESSSSAIFITEILFGYLDTSFSGFYFRND